MTVTTKVLTISDDNLNIPHGIKISSCRWLVEQNNLYQLLRDIISGDLTADDKLIMQLKNVVQSAMVNSDGWRKPRFKNIEQGNTRNLNECIKLVRYTEDYYGNHLAIEIITNDHKLITCPSVCEILWNPSPYIVDHLNRITFMGGSWVDVAGAMVLENHVIM